MFWWPEQEEYEKLGQPVLFGGSIAVRAAEVGGSESTLRRNIEGFRTEAMDSLYSSEKARRKQLPPVIRRLIVDLKAEYPPFNTNEIANIVHACFGRTPDVRSVKRVLDEEPTDQDSLRRRRQDAKARAARTFSVSLSSVKRYVNKASRGESLALKKRPGSAPKLDDRRCAGQPPALRPREFAPAP